ncbi:MAG: hypothetical protein LBJ10_12295 [Clostridiales bacterium]|jgi:hypothetical protein|nr:hypothetical protein [Clostridiales bacterium]
MLMPVIHTKLSMANALNLPLLREKSKLSLISTHLLATHLLATHLLDNANKLGAPLRAAQKLFYTCDLDVSTLHARVDIARDLCQDNGNGRKFFACRKIILLRNCVGTDAHVASSSRARGAYARRVSDHDAAVSCQLVTRSIVITAMPRFNRCAFSKSAICAARARRDGGHAIWAKR